ncbi:MAG TPA: N-acetylmuramic acid 6-phosphate etherase [Candidatus Baltobacteraceae bacterium]|nr:N-acetylmuramic acid 6-phosphate etherase [Candidatus Baltobacteraceae bacterium]
MSELPATEAVNPRSAGLDTMSTRELVDVLALEQHAAVDAVAAAAPALAHAVDGIVRRLESGGRLHYFGAGSSGRIGVLDASEMPPTFGTDPTMVCAHIAGGHDALTRAVEGAEDDGAAGAAAAQACANARDAVVGISASGGAPYVVGAVAQARALGAFTIGIASVENSALTRAAELPIVLATGAEPLSGSTRLKAGTAQKIALNTLSTAVMVRLGKVYDNLMVDVVAGNAKLRARAIRLVRHLTGVEEERARQLLGMAGGRVKIAAVMARRNVGVEEALALLERHRGSLRAVL